ncbi:MAG: EAL domain-containing protein [Sneathiellaceae bacterium]
MRSDDTVFVAAGAEIFRQGDPGDCAYVVEDGRIAITLDDDRVSQAVATRGPGEIFGEMAIIDGSPRSATATAIEDARLLVVTADRLSHRMARADPVLRMVLDVLASRLRATMALLARTDGRDAKPHGGASQLQNRGIQDIRLEQDLVRALSNGDFQLHYQPIVDLASRKAVGFEALSRWLHPVHGMLPPQEFIPRAEASGLITALTRWALPRALDELETLIADLPPGALELPYVAVNVSVADLQDPTFPEFLAGILVDRPFAKGQLRIEVTESLMLADPEPVRRSLDLCRALGVGVAIDDFGTGYSSLSTLHMLPISALKIDRSFVVGFDQGDGSRKTVRTILRLAEDLGIPTIAEGVETVEQARILAAMGCDKAQGYLYARPMPLEAARAWLRDWDSNRRDVA